MQNVPGSRGLLAGLAKLVRGLLGLRNLSLDGLLDVAHPHRRAHDRRGDHGGARKGRPGAHRRRGTAGRRDCGNAADETDHLERRGGEGERMECRDQGGTETSSNAGRKRAKGGSRVERGAGSPARGYLSSTSWTCEKVADRGCTDRRGGGSLRSRLRHIRCNVRPLLRGVQWGAIARPT